MTDREILTKAHEILSSDGGAESDSVAMDIIDGKKVSQREQMMAEMITILYKLIHPYMGCQNPHEDWKKEL